ncbi:MAG TPA: NfeD family protein [Acidimicrobiia bacterium]
MRRLLLLTCAAFSLLACGEATSSGPVVEVIEVNGLIDNRMIAYMHHSIEAAAEAGRELAIIQINSPGVVGSFAGLSDLGGLLADPALPVVTWLGPAPAAIGGGAAQLFSQAPFRTAASGTRIEHWSPAVTTGEGELAPPPTGWPGFLEVVEPSPPIDLVVPSLRQLVQELNGTEMTVRGETHRLRLLASIEDEGGDVTTIPVVFTQPGLWDRFLHLAVRPEAAFFFLVAGLTIAIFEMHAIGPGVAAAVAALSLFLAGHGLAVLPVRGWAIVAAVTAIGVLAAGAQKGGVLALTILGTGLLLWSGFALNAGAPQVETSPIGVLLGVAAVLFFFLLAIPTVARARLSTRTIGRERLIGRAGRALSDFLPDGLVEIDGARWPATAHREAAISEGAEVVVVAVYGARVEVDPVPLREN